MANNLINIEEIRRKNEIVDNAIEVLKKEFIGIDKQIDEIMDNVRTWYLYPNLQTRPLVVCLWGMSGIGKTSVIKRISQLLDIEKDYVYWNFASIGELSSWEVEHQIEEELSNESSKRMFVYDEFQYAATITKGGELEQKSGLKPFWELLDSGLLHKRPDFWNVRTPFKILSYIMRINAKCQMEIKNGVWVNAAECLEYFKPYDIQQFMDVFNIETNSSNDYSRKVEQCVKVTNLSIKGSECSNYDETVNNDNDRYIQPFFIKEGLVNEMITLHDKVYGGVSDRIDTYHKLEEMTCEEIIDFISEIYENARKGYNLKFNDSIIFVIGNLDEAYHVSFDVNPDMSPDQFRKITEKINIVDIKAALRQRFRNEQIARLGNIHVIYPSFSKKNFEDIIQLSLDTYEKEVYCLIGIHLKFDDTIKQIIYDEGVFPTHGTRPIFSTVYEIVKSRLPKIVRAICENGLKDEVTFIKYIFDYVNNRILVNCCGKRGKVKHVVEFDNIKLRLKNFRDIDESDEQQALYALHESGHFVMYVKLFGKLPEKLVSKTVEANTGGFLMEDVDEAKKKVSKNDMLNEIQVLLGGYVAEKIYFGDEMSNGASSDLERATKMASSMVRRYGMGINTFVSTYTSDKVSDPYGLLVKEDNQDNINQNIKDIISFAVEEVRRTLTSYGWREMLKESALYLCENSSMPKYKMAEIYDNVADSLKSSARSESYYHKMIEEI